MNYPVCDVCRRETLTTNIDGKQCCNQCLPIPEGGLRYYHVSFDYPSSKPPSEREESRLLGEAIRAVEDICIVAGIEVRHEYAWPDGSCFQYLRTELSLNDLNLKLNRIFPGPHKGPVWIKGIRQIAPLTQTIRDRTVESEFPATRKLGKPTFKLTFDPSWKLELVRPSANPEDVDDYFHVKEDGTSIAWFPEEEDAKTFIRAKRKEWGYDKLAALLKGSELEFGEDV